MSFLLDTDICSFHLRRSGALTSRFTQYGGQLAVSTIVAAELYVSARGLDDPSRRLAMIDELLDQVELLVFDLSAAEQFGVLRSSQLKVGIITPAIDLMIASIALVHDLTLVTHNTKDFQHIPGLRLEDWIADL